MMKVRIGRPSGKRTSEKDWKRLYRIILVWFLFIIPFIVPANGDGFVIYGEESLEFLLEEDQYAMIDLENGIQKMLIKIDIEEKDVSNSTWILPVPAQPDEIGFDIEANMPYFSGQNLEEAYNDELEEYRNEILGSHYSSFFPGLRMLYFISYSGSFTDDAGGVARSIADVEIHDSVFLEGINSELVSSNDTWPLLDHFRDRGLPIEMGTFSSFDHYVENGFSFIVTWMDTNSLQGLKPALYIEFPSEDYYYPMLLTSEYGDSKVPVNILINDYVKPDEGLDLSYDVKRTYYRDYWDLEMEHEVQAHEALRKNHPETEYMDHSEIMERYGHLLRSHYFENQTKGSDRYTLLEIDAKAMEFTEDLYFVETEPDVIDKQRKLDEARSEIDSLWKRALVFLCLSMISAAISGFLFLRKDPSKVPLAIVLSMFNVMAIWLFTIATLILVRPKEAGEWWNFLGFTAVFHAVFFLLFFIMLEPLFIFI